MVTIEKMKKEYIDDVYEIDKMSVPIPWSKNSIEEEAIFEIIMIFKLFIWLFILK